MTNILNILNVENINVQLRDTCNNVRNTSLYNQLNTELNKGYTMIFNNVDKDSTIEKVLVSLKTNSYDILYIDKQPDDKYCTYYDSKSLYSMAYCSHRPKYKLEYDMKMLKDNDVYDEDLNEFKLTGIPSCGKICEHHINKVFYKDLFKSVIDLDTNNDVKDDLVTDKTKTFFKPKSKPKTKTKTKSKKK